MADSDSDQRHEGISELFCTRQTAKTEDEDIRDHRMHEKLPQLAFVHVKAAILGTLVDPKESKCAQYYWSSVSGV